MSTYSEDMLSGALAQFKGNNAGVLQALQRTQELLGYVPDTALDVIAGVCNVSRAEVYGVVTFYSDFRRSAPADVIVNICVAEACQSVGSREVVSDLHKMGYDVHTKSQKDDIQCQQAFCLGNCALGPAALVNGKPVGRISAKSVIEAAKAAKR